jgi:hypothetical protein
MDKNRINNSAAFKSFTNKDHLHSLNKLNESEKNGNKLNAVVLPVLFAFIACVTPVLFIIIDWSKGVKLTLSKPLECKMLCDSLKGKTAEFNKLKSDRNKYDYEKYRLDSVLLEQAMYDLSKEIQKSKCD